MPRAWFRHQPNMRYDPAISVLCEEFGPLGDLVWRRLLELHCDDDAGIVVRIEDLGTALALRPEWEVDLAAWLARAAELRLIRVRQSRSTRNNALQIVARRWSVYNPEYASREGAAERKRRSRAKPVTVTDSDGHCDVTVTSQSPGRDVRTGLDVQDERSGPNAREPESRAGVSHGESKAEANGHGSPMPPDVHELKRKLLAPVAKAMP